MEQAKPLMRGYTHQAAFYFFLGAGLLLIAGARTELSRLAAVVYVVSLTGLFGVSALYHRPYWGSVARKWLRRLDHSSIFVLIAGSATPILMLGLQDPQWRKILWIIWSVAALGVLKCFFWTSAPKILNVIIYVCAGCLAVPYFSSVKFLLNGFESILLFSGGVLYIAGAVIYFFKKPDPFPKTFGYHEIFHALVVVASTLHFILIYDLIAVS